MRRALACGGIALDYVKIIMSDLFSRDSLLLQQFGVFIEVTVYV